MVLDGMQVAPRPPRTSSSSTSDPDLGGDMPQAVESLVELGMHRKVQLMVSAARGAGPWPRHHTPAPTRCCSGYGVAALDRARRQITRAQDKLREDRLRRGLLRRLPGRPRPGRDISTQEPELKARLDPVEGGRRLANYLRTLTLEAQTLARACGKSHLLNLEPEDLVALTDRGVGDGARAVGRNELDPGAIILIALGRNRRFSPDRPGENRGRSVPWRLRPGHVAVPGSTPLSGD